MPNIHLWRPADMDEMVASYQSAVQHRHTPSFIACCRASVKGQFGSSTEKAMKGAYTIIESAETPALIIISTGQEITFCAKAVEKLVAIGIPTALVSMPCQDVFLEQSQEYQASILPGNIPTLSVEASAVHGWHRFSHAQVGIDNMFGASADGDALFEYYGFTPENIANKGKTLVEFYKGKTVPNLRDVPIFEPFAKPVH